MERLKAILLSPAGMKIVNVLFFLTVLIRNNGLIIVAHLVWVLYLVVIIKNTADKTLKTVYRVMVIYAVVIIAANGYFLIHGN